MNVNSSLKMMCLREAVMKRLVVFMCLAVAVLVVAPTGQVQAEIIQYTISVNVTDADESPGYVPWAFSSVPATFSGTFDADDTVTGSISNFALTVGGLDIATSHPDSEEAENNFDPTSLLLDWGSYNTPVNSFVGFGDLADVGFIEGASPPVNYVVAIEDNDDLPLDPFYNYTQNWVGTYSIAPSTAVVPEPSSIAMFGIGALSLFGYSRRRRQTSAAA